MFCTTSLEFVKVCDKVLTVTINGTQHVSATI